MGMSICIYKKDGRTRIRQWIVDWFDHVCWGIWKEGKHPWNTLSLAHLPYIVSANYLNQRKHFDPSLFTHDVLASNQPQRLPKPFKTLQFQNYRIGINRLQTCKYRKLSSTTCILKRTPAGNKYHKLFVIPWLCRERFIITGNYWWLYIRKSIIMTLIDKHFSKLPLTHAGKLKIH